MSRTGTAKVPLHSLLLVRFMRPVVRIAQRLLWRGKRPDVARIENRSVETPGVDVPVRIYTPEGDGPFPILVFFHGSGFVICDIDTHDGLCRDLCRPSGCIVVSVDYRLSPEHKFPAAVNDCYAVTRWAAEHAAEITGDANTVFVVGDSAGGNMAAVTSLRIRDEGGPTLTGQVLIYPVTDYHTPPTASYLENAHAKRLTRKRMIWFWRQYLSEPVEAEDPYASPLRAGRFDGLPPALVLTAVRDPLRDEGECYAARLEDAGVPTQSSRYDGLYHGFLGLEGPTADHQRGVAEIAAWIEKTIEARNTANPVGSTTGPQHE
jgi:acetyl esterase